MSFLCCGKPANEQVAATTTSRSTETGEQDEASQKKTALVLVKKLASQLKDTPSEGGCGCKEGVGKLRAGNKCYLDVGNNIDYLSRLTQRVGPERRNALTGGQTPYVTVVACSDSRVPPELVFNGGLGEIFVIRNAGNTWDTAMLATVQYGIVHLKTPVLCILGHQSCGAVAATMGAVNDAEKADTADEAPAPVGGAKPNYLLELLEKLTPAVKSAVKSVVKHKPQGVDWMADEDTKQQVMQVAVEKNVCNTCAKIMEELPDVKAKVDSGEVTVIKAWYQLGTGEVKEIQR